jgi:hypothetical protein
MKHNILSLKNFSKSIYIVKIIDKKNYKTYETKIETY